MVRWLQVMSQCLKCPDNDAAFSTPMLCFHKLKILNFYAPTAESHDVGVEDSPKALC